MLALEEERQLWQQIHTMTSHQAQKTNRQKTSRIYNLISASLAFLLWGGWAFYINGGIEAAGIVSGITQGTASFIITLFMVRAVAWLFSLFASQYAQLLMPAMMTVGLTGSGLVFIHYLVGTPEILKTVSPALTVAFLFCIFTSYKLFKASRKERPGHE